MPPKGHKKKPGRRQLELNEKRCYIIRKLLAAGYYTPEIINRCRKHAYFEKIRKRTPRGPASKGDKHLSRDNIAKWIQNVKKDLRLNMFTETDEISDAYERLLWAYRKAERRGDVKGMVLSQREINRMLGLRRMPSGAQMDPEELAAQTVEMGDSVPEWVEDVQDD